MPFYTYTLNKMLKSVSTYIILFIATSIPMIVALTDESKYISIVLYATFPIFIILITFKTSQVFRDEIDNNTMLTIQAKPITRSKLVFEGYLALMTILAISLISVSLVPVFISVVKNEDSFARPFLVTLTLLLLSAIISAIALLLSLLIKGKPFIGVMIGGIGVGFYILLGISSMMIFLTSTSANVANVMKDDSFGPHVYHEQAQYSNGKYIPNQYIFMHSEGHITTANKDEIYADLQEKYELASNANHATYNYLKWFDVSLHWATMFGNSLDKSPTRNFSGGSSPTLGPEFVFNSKEIRVVSVKWIDDVHHEKGFIVTIENNPTIPIWYPYLVWTLIGATVIILVVNKIKRINIA